jgi:hypothetical protein
MGGRGSVPHVRRLLLSAVADDAYQSRARGLPADASGVDVRLSSSGV